jgi:hypothetical protein
MLSPAPVQKYPIFFGLMLLAVNGGDAKGGVGTCKIGKGGALLARGSVTPGIEGISGGRDNCGSGSGVETLRAARAEIKKMERAIADAERADYQRQDS